MAGAAQAPVSGTGAASSAAQAAAAAQQPVAGSGAASVADQAAGVGAGEVEPIEGSGAVSSSDRVAGVAAAPITGAGGAVESVDSDGGLGGISLEAIGSAAAGGIEAVGAGAAGELEPIEGAGLFAAPGLTASGRAIIPAPAPPARRAVAAAEFRVSAAPGDRRQCPCSKHQSRIARVSAERRAA